LFLEKQCYTFIVLLTGGKPIFRGALNKYPFKGSGTYLLLGKIVEEFGFPSLEVEKMAKLPIRRDLRY